MSSLQRQEKMPLSERNHKNFRSEKIRTYSKSFYKPPTQLPTYASDELMINNRSSALQTERSKPKTPHLNFNMHYLISKRKKLNILDETVIKGSNVPYYTFFNSDKYHDEHYSRLNTSSERVSRMRVSKTAEGRKKN